MLEIERVSVNVSKMKNELANFKNTLAQMEQSTEGFVSMAQETLASSEQMLHTSTKQIEQLNLSYDISVRLTNLSLSLEKLTAMFRI